MKKRLFKCSAYVNMGKKGNGYSYTLVSYNTKICQVDISFDCDGWENIDVELWRYPTITSQQHIYKFAKWLNQNIKGSAAGRIVELLQAYCVERKCNYGIYDGEDGEFEVYKLTTQALSNLGFEYNKPY